VKVSECRRPSVPAALCATLIAATAVTACAPATPPPPPLEPADFVLAGVPPDADSAEIRLSFGEPDSIVASQDPYAAASTIEAWFYPGIVVRYTGEAVPSSFLIEGRDESTARGIRVGDPTDLVLSRYGEPLFRYDDIWTYAEPGADVEPYVIEFLMEDGVVRRIHVGRTDG
jgi:hypothetical protein